MDGLITIVPWSQPTVLINGTVTARGLGSSLSVVKITNSSNNGNIIFQAAFPVNPGFFFSQSYNVKINVFIPSTIRFNYVRISNVNGGVRINNLNSTSLNLTTTNGAASVDCVYCLNMTASSTNGSISAKFEAPLTAGSFNLTSTNANVDFSVPSSSSFKVTATAVTGSIQVYGWTIVTPATQNSLSHTFGAGGASVSLKSVNGQITITGT